MVWVMLDASTVYLADRSKQRHTLEYTLNETYVHPDEKVICRQTTGKTGISLRWDWR